MRYSALFFSLPCFFSLAFFLAACDSAPEREDSALKTMIKEPKAKAAAVVEASEERDEEMESQLEELDSED
jgi:hypothetical protein